MAEIPTFNLKEVRPLEDFVPSIVERTVPKRLTEIGEITMLCRFDPPGLTFDTIEQLEEFVGRQFTEDEAKLISQEGFPITMYPQELPLAGMTPAEAPISNITIVPSDK